MHDERKSQVRCLILVISLSNHQLPMKRAQQRTKDDAIVRPDEIGSNQEGPYNLGEKRERGRIHSEVSIYIMTVRIYRKK